MLVYIEQDTYMQASRKFFTIVGSIVSPGAGIQ